jgi:hypothetical protein
MSARQCRRDLAASGWRDHHGKRRVRFPQAWPFHLLERHAVERTFHAPYPAALDGVKAQAQDIGAGRIKPGTINALIVSYYKLVFPLLKPSTQRQRRYILERFRAEHGDKPVARLEQHHIAQHHCRQGEHAGSRK